MSGMAVTLGVLDGDGIGPEIVPAAVRVIQACADRYDFAVEFVDLPVGWAAYETDGTTLPDRTLNALADCDGWILGPVDSAAYPADDALDGNPSGAIRTHFDLYANVRPVQSYPGFGPENVDITVVRQNTEGFYADRNMAVGNGEFMPTDDLVLSMRVVTEHESRRIARQAFEYADDRGLPSVTIVHKANVLRLGDGMFLDICEAVGEEYPDITVDDFHVDAFAMELSISPEAYDVVVTTNMFGDILSDQTAGIVGSLGLAPSLNAGDEYAMAQAVHGAAPDIAGDGTANPTAIIRSCALLLRWLGRQRDDDRLHRAADDIDAAVEATITNGDVLTPDLGGEASTDEFAVAVVAALSEGTRG